MSTALVRAGRGADPGGQRVLGILPGRAALLAELGAGTLSYASGGHRRSLGVEGGWLRAVAGRDRLARFAELRYRIRSDRTRTHRTHHAAPRA